MRTVGGGAHIPGQAAGMPNVKKRVMKRGSHARKRRLQKGCKESAVRGVSFAGVKPTGQPGGDPLGVSREGVVILRVEFLDRVRVHFQRHLYPLPRPAKFC